MRTKNCLALITARGGSKRIPNKNLVKINGLSLVGRTLKAALDANIFSHIVLSSDSDQILKEALKFKNVIPLKRTAHLASDTAKSMDVILDIINKPEFRHIENLCLLQPTSPLRTKKHLQESYHLFERFSTDAVVSVAPIVTNPFHMVVTNSMATVEPLMGPKIFSFRTQDTPEIYALNGAIYIATVKKLKKDKSFLGKNTLVYKMSLKDSLDIDEPKDLKLARKLLSKSKKTKKKSK